MGSVPIDSIEESLEEVLTFTLRRSVERVTYFPIRIKAEMDAKEKKELIGSYVSEMLSKIAHIREIDQLTAYRKEKQRKRRSCLKTIAEVNNYKDLNNLLSQTDNLMTSSTSYMALDELVKMRSKNGAKNESQSLKYLQTVYKTDIKECSENKSGLPSRSCKVSNSCSSDMTPFSSIPTMSSIPSTEDIDEFISDEDLQSKKNNVPATVSQDALLGHHKISARKYGFFKRIGKQFRKLLTW